MYALNYIRRRPVPPTPSPRDSRPLWSDAERERRRVLLKDDSTPHEWCRPTRKAVQGITCSSIPRKQAKRDCTTNL